MQTFLSVKTEILVRAIHTLTPLTVMTVVAVLMTVALTMRGMSLSI